jgi:lysozyme
MSNDNQKLTDGQKGTAITAVILAAVAVAAPLAQRWEGYVDHVYRDPANIPTYCYGETGNISKDPSRIYLKTECADLLRKRMARDYAPRILQCIPQLADKQRVNVFGALIDASYNAGWQSVCRSPMRTDIIAGKWTSACNRLPSWYVTAQRRVNGKRVGQPFVLRGLVNRRNDEKKVCLTGRL